MFLLTDLVSILSSLIGWLFLLLLLVTILLTLIGAFEYHRSKKANRELLRQQQLQRSSSNPTQTGGNNTAASANNQTNIQPTTITTTANIQSERHHAHLERERERERESRDRSRRFQEIPDDDAPHEGEDETETTSMQRRAGRSVEGDRLAYSHSRGRSIYNAVKKASKRPPLAAPSAASTAVSATAQPPNQPTLAASTKRQATPDVNNSEVNSVPASPAVSPRIDVGISRTISSGTNRSVSPLTPHLEAESPNENDSDEDESQSQSESNASNSSSDRLARKRARKGDGTRFTFMSDATQSSHSSSDPTPVHESHSSAAVAHPIILSDSAHALLDLCPELSAEDLTPAQGGVAAIHSTPADIIHAQIVSLITQSRSQGLLSFVADTIRNMIDQELKHDKITSIQATVLHKLLESEESDVKLVTRIDEACLPVPSRVRENGGEVDIDSTNDIIVPPPTNLTPQRGNQPRLPTHTDTTEADRNTMQQHRQQLYVESIAQIPSAVSGVSSSLDSSSLPPAIHPSFSTSSSSSSGASPSVTPGLLYGRSLESSRKNSYEVAATPVSTATSTSLTHMPMPMPTATNSRTTPDETNTNVPPTPSATTAAPFSSSFTSLPMVDLPAIPPSTLSTNDLISLNLAFLAESHTRRAHIAQQTCMALVTAQAASVTVATQVPLPSTAAVAATFDLPALPPAESISPALVYSEMHHLLQAMHVTLSNRLQARMGMQVESEEESSVSADGGVGVVGPLSSNLAAAPSTSLAHPRTPHRPLSRVHSPDSATPPPPPPPPMTHSPPTTPSVSRGSMSQPASQAGTGPSTRSTSAHSSGTTTPTVKGSGVNVSSATLPPATVAAPQSAIITSPSEPTSVASSSAAPSSALSLSRPSLSRPFSLPVRPATLLPPSGSPTRREGGAMPIPTPLPAALRTPPPLTSQQQNAQYTMFTPSPGSTAATYAISAAPAQHQQNVAIAAASSHHPTSNGHSSASTNATPIKRTSQHNGSTFAPTPASVSFASSSFQTSPGAISRSVAGTPFKPAGSINGNTNGNTIGHTPTTQTRSHRHSPTYSTATFPPKKRGGSATDQSIFSMIKNLGKEEA